jgi:hypothetical protein
LSDRDNLLHVLKKETIDYIIRNRKIERTFDDYLNYWFLFVPIAFVVMGYSILFGYFRYQTGGTLLLLSILYLVVGLFGCFFFLKRFNENISFVCLPCPDHDLDMLAQKLKEHFKIINMAVDKDLKTIVAVTKWSAFSWGEQLIVIIDDDNVLVNSRPNSSRQPFTLWKDRQNIKCIGQLL